MTDSADIDVLRFLVDHGVDPHAIPQGGNVSPLFRAVHMGRMDYLDFILGLGVDPNADLGRQRVTLIALGSQHPAAATQIEILERLIRHEVDLNFRFSLFGDKAKCFTVLDHATDESVRSFLRDHGAKTALELSGEASQPVVSRGDASLDEVIEYMRGLFGNVESRSFADLLNADSGITVHVILPKSTTGFLTLFTTGMSVHRMNVAKESACSGYGELYMQLPGGWKLHDKDPKWKWPVQLMLDLASYPGNEGGYFEVPVTVISNGDPPTRLDPSVPFEATALLADKGFKRSDGQTVQLFCVMPIYEAEANMARRSIPEFLKALDRAGVGRVLKKNRVNIASS